MNTKEKSNGIYSILSRLLPGLFVVIACGSVAYGQEPQSATIETVGTLDGQSFTLVAQLEYYDWRSAFGGQYKVSLMNSIKGAPFNVTARHWANGAGGPWTGWTQGQYWDQGKTLYLRATVQNPDTGWTTSVVYSVTVGEGISLCGPIEIDMEIKNQESRSAVYALFRGGVEIAGSRFRVGPFLDYPLYWYSEEECEEVTLYRLGTEGDVWEATTVFHPSEVEGQEPMPGDQQPANNEQIGPRHLDFDETELKAIVTDETKTDAEKEAESRYVLWKADQGKQDEIIDVLKNIEENTEPGEGEEATTGDLLDELVKHNEREEAREIRTQEALDANPTTGDMQSQGAAAKGEIEGVYQAHMVQPVSYDAAGGAAPAFLMTLPGGRTIDLNPFREDRLGPVLGWFRAAFAWLVLVQLGSYVWKEVAEMTRAIGAVRQAKGNPVVGGTGAQATALVAAGIITAIVVSGTVALLSFTFGDVSIDLIRSTLAMDPVGSMPGNVLWLLNAVFPVATILSAAVARVTFPMYGSAIFAGITAAIRFVVP